MGFQARLEDGTVIAPAVEVLSGRLTPEQANRKYKGVTGVCPQCTALRRRQQGTDNAAIQAALSIADLSVDFVPAVIQQGEMKRIPHFSHRPGFLQTDAASLLCRESKLGLHAAAVEVIGEWAREMWRDCTVRAELNVVAPGTPPQTFRPDVAIHDADGSPVACIEYQRTAETFDAFKERHELRLTQFPEVVWFFGPGAYMRSGNHRQYLAIRRHRFARCWLDPETQGLRYEWGRPPAPVREPVPEHKAAPCSEASLIRALERQGESSRPAVQPTINTAIPLLHRDEAYVPTRPAPSLNATPSRYYPPPPAADFNPAKGEVLHLWHTSYRDWVPDYVVEESADDRGLVKVRRRDSKQVQHVRLRHLRRAS